MKAFNEWNKKQKEPNFDYDSVQQRNTFECQFEKERAKGWKGVLEWFSSRLGYSEEHKALQDIIDKELGDEKN